MYVEILDGRYAGQTRDIEPGAALDLISLGRAKRAFGEPTPGNSPRMGVPETPAVIEVAPPLAAIEIEPKATVPTKQHPGHKKNR
jgi:hypothetical protein